MQKEPSYSNKCERSVISSTLLILDHCHIRDNVVFLFWVCLLRGNIIPFSQRSNSHYILCFSCFSCQFYNALCRNLPRRYVLPLSVDQHTPLDQNLVTLHYCAATATMTAPGEVGPPGMQYAHCVYMCVLTVHQTIPRFTGQN